MWTRPNDAALGSRDPGAIRLGRYWDGSRNTAGDKLCYGGNRHALVFGPTRSGKGARLLAVNALQSDGDKSQVWIDPKGELAAITAKYRRLIGNVLVLNPFQILTDYYPDLASAGFNPLAGLNPDSPTFYDDAAALGEALIKIEGSDPFWSESAQGLVVALIMWVRICDGVNASLEAVRALLTEADEYEKDNGGHNVLIRGLRVTAQMMVDDGGPVIASLVGRFLQDNRTVDGIRSTADTQTRWMLSEPMRADLAKNGVDLAQLKWGPRPVTLFVILPSERMRTHSVWLRLVITSVLRAQYQPGGRTVLLGLDEAAALGRLGPIEDALGLAAGFGLQILSVWQDLNQLRELYKDRWRTFIAQAGAVIAFAPADDETAEWMSKRCGETTIVTPGASEGMSAGAREGFNEGESYQLGKRRYLLPHELFGMREGFALVWCAGLADVIPAYVPAYFDIEQCVRRARPNPYYRHKRSWWQWLRAAAGAASP